MSQAITKRQKQLLDFIQKYAEKKGINPSLQEMAEALDLSSLSSVHYHLARLEGKALISRTRGGAPPLVYPPADACSPFFEIFAISVNWADKRLISELTRFRRPGDSRHTLPLRSG